MPFERAHNAAALDRIIDLGIAGVDILGQFALFEHARGRVFEGGLHIVGAEPEAGGDRLRESLRVVGERPIGGGLRRNERVGVPKRLSLAPPIERGPPAPPRPAPGPLSPAPRARPPPPTTPPPPPPRTHP